VTSRRPGLNHRRSRKLRVRKEERHDDEGESSRNRRSVTVIVSIEAVKGSVTMTMIEIKL
jgi:hypothetical protein